MNRRGVRITVFALFLLGAGTMIARLWMLERGAEALADAGRSFDAAAARVLVDLGELRAAQQAYVATGQAGDEWIARVRTVLDGIDATLDEMETSAPEHAPALQPVREALQEFRGADARAVEYLARDQTLMASDLILAEGGTLVAKTSEALLAAIRQREDSVAAAAAAVRRQRASALAAAAGALVVLALLLLPLPTSREERPQPSETRAQERSRPVEPATPPVSQATPVIARRETDDVLPTVATLCTDFGRVTDSAELPALLERGSRLIGASGLIVWLTDAVHQELRPAIVFGYSAQFVGRMRGIPRDADNPTAHALRDASAKIVPAAGSARAALAVPIISSVGAVGVLAVELQNGKDADEPTRALAVILAAQLAPLLAEPSAEPAEDDQELPASRASRA